ncbi:MAG TPA: hypothetical protein VFT62_11060 [Mycobacteriales bacterium]|nr:hypothetical protein [Mycobacteriales bacterium]
MIWLAVAAIVIVALGLYANWAARRLDRLHVRLDAAAAALDAQLRARAAVAARVAESAELPRAAGDQLRAAAGIAAQSSRLDHGREAVESALSRAVQSSLAALPPRSAAAADLVDAATRASFARSFHNDAVRDALVVRRRRIVRLLHLAGHAPHPSYFEMDDAVVVISEVVPAAAPYD